MSNIFINNQEIDKNETNKTNECEKYKAFVVMNGNSKTIKSKTNLLNNNKIKNEMIITNNNNNNNINKNDKEDAIIIGQCTKKMKSSSINSMNKLNDDCPNKLDDDDNNKVCFAKMR